MLNFQLNGKKGLIVGIANEQSIAYGCAKVCYQCGADLAITYLNEKAEKYVRPLAESLQSKIIMPLNVEDNQQLDQVFQKIEQEWGQLDFLIHAIAFAPKDDLYGEVYNCSQKGFLQAFDVSCHSFIRMTKKAVPLMKKGGSIMTMSFYGAEKVVQNYNIMGPAKAALEGITRSLAAELAPKNIRVNAISPGLIKTRAASGIQAFESLYENYQKKTPGKTVEIEDIGKISAFLASDWSKIMVGNIVYADSGYHIIG